MAIQKSRDLFLYDLRAMYDVEQKLLQMLPVLAQECIENAAREAFLMHEQETRQHIRNLEQCFQIMDSQPVALENNTVAGLKQDHDAFLQQQPPVQAIILFDLHAGYQSECLEIAAYHNLIDIANLMGLQDCVLLFQQNLQQEVSASQKFSAIAHQYGQQQIQPQQAQNPVPAVPMPGPANAGANPQMQNQPASPNPYMQSQGQAYPAVYQQMPNQPDVASQQQAQMPNQPYANTNPAQPGQDYGTTGSHSAADLASQVQQGMWVVGSDKSNIGRIKEVRDNDFLVDIPLQRDLYVPFTAVQNVDADRVMLNIQGNQVNDMNWSKPSLT